MSNGASNGNGNGKFTMEKELWAWRAMMIFLLLTNLITSFITFQIDRSQHAIDNKERAAAWQYMKDRLEGNRSMIMKNHEAVLTIDEHLRQCSGCHSHPPVHK